MARRRNYTNKPPPERNWRATALDVMMHHVLRLKDRNNEERLNAICKQQMDKVGDIKAFIYHSLLYRSSHYGDSPIPQNLTHVLDPSLHAAMDTFLESKKDFKRREIFIRSVLMNALNISQETIEVCAYLPPSFMQSLPQKFAAILSGEHAVTSEQVFQFEQANKEGMQFLKEQMMLNILEG